jgi:hypothetical protein
MHKSWNLSDTVTFLTLWFPCLHRNRLLVTWTKQDPVTHTMSIFEKDKKWVEGRSSGRTCNSEKDTDDMEGTETVHGTVPKHSVDPKCISVQPDVQWPKNFNLKNASPRVTVTRRQTSSEHPEVTVVHSLEQFSRLRFEISWMRLRFLDVWDSTWT